MSSPESRIQTERHQALLHGGTNVRMHIRHMMKAVRREARQICGRALTKLLRPRHCQAFLDPCGLSTVLICRINGRLGNTVFLTPAIRILHEIAPRASIDLLLGHPAAAELLSHLPGVRRVVVFPRKTGALWRYLQTVRMLRGCFYDLAIDPVPASLSGRIAMCVCRARYRLGYDNSTQWAPLTHRAPEPTDLRASHEALRPVFLLAHAFRASWRPADVRLWLPLPADALVEGRRVVRQFCQDAHRVFGFFAHATDRKIVARQWWQAFWDAFLSMVPLAVPLEFLPSSAHSPLDRRFAHVHLPSLSILTAAIDTTRLFISADTGPMHLASATRVPTIALFHSGGAPLYGPLKPEDLSIDLTISSPEEVAFRCRRMWLSSMP